MRAMSKWEQIKDIKGLLTSIFAFCTVVIAVGGYVMNLAIDSKVNTAVAAKLAEQDLATDSNIVAIKSDVQENTRTGSENAEDIDQNRRNVEAAFRRLMGIPDDS